jgi:hypothetical protein
VGRRPIPIPEPAGPAVDATVIDRALALVELGREYDAEGLFDHFSWWAEHNPHEVARVAVVLALMADNKVILVQLSERVQLDKDSVEKADRQAHAAYARGEITDAVLAGERRYQRKRKRSNSDYVQHRQQLHRLRVDTAGAA